MRLKSASSSSPPLQVTRLLIQDCSVEPSDLSFFHHLLSLEFSSVDINQPLDSLPPSITFIQFPHSFNQFVNHLPPSLAQLTFGDSCNHPVHKLPSSLKKNHFGESFNQSVDSLPTGVTHLTFYGSFNQPLDHPLFTHTSPYL